MMWPIHYHGRPKTTAGRVPKSTHQRMCYVLLFPRSYSIEASFCFSDSQHRLLCSIEVRMELGSDHCPLIQTTLVNQALLLHSIKSSPCRVCILLLFPTATTTDDSANRLIALGSNVPLRSCLPTLASPCRARILRIVRRVKFFVHSKVPALPHILIHSALPTSQSWLWFRDHPLFLPTSSYFVLLTVPVLSCLTPFIASATCLYVCTWPRRDLSYCICARPHVQVPSCLLNMANR